MKVNVTPVKVWKSDDDACLFVMTATVNPATSKRWTYWCKKDDLFPHFNAGEPVTCQVKVHEKTTGKTYEIVGIGDEEVVEETKTPAKPQVSDKARDKSIAFSYVKDYKVAQIKAGVIKEINRAELLSMFTMAELIANWMNGEFIVEPVKKKTEPE